MLRKGRKWVRSRRANTRSSLTLRAPLYEDGRGVKRNKIKLKKFLESRFASHPKSSYQSWEGIESERRMRQPEFTWGLQKERRPFEVVHHKPQFHENVASRRREGLESELLPPTWAEAASAQDVSKSSFNVQLFYESNWTSAKRGSGVTVIGSESGHLHSFRKREKRSPHDSLTQIRDPL